MILCRPVAVPWAEWEMTAMKRVLVTGGAGFIGSHLCERPLRGFL